MLQCNQSIENGWLCIHFWRPLKCAQPNIRFPLHYGRQGIAVNGSIGRNIFGIRSNSNGDRTKKKTLESNAVKNAYGTSGAESAWERIQQTEKYLINGYYFGSCRYANGFWQTKTKLYPQNV